MAKMTLLDMTQNILSAMDSDEVNSINDTIESQQVAEIIKETYYFLFSTIELPEKVGLVKLSGLGDLTQPNYLEMPSNLVSIVWLKYLDSGSDRYYDLTFMPQMEFMDRVLNNTSTSSDVTAVTDGQSGVTYYVKNNQRPRYYTILNDKYVVTDGYDSTYDTTLQASKTLGWGELEETWVESDSFIPNIDTDLFPLLLSEAKSTCFITLKQIANPKEDQKARKGRVHLQYRKWRDKRERGNVFSGVNYAKP